jgi:hypothetical protein
MPYSTAAKNLMLNALRGTNPTTPITHVSLHTANPGDTGASEVSGGSPAYARVAIAFNAAAAGAMDDSTNGATLNVPASTTVAYVGFWSASTAGTWLGYVDVTDEVFASQGTYTVTDADLDLNA